MLSHIINTTKYTPLELILFGTGCYLWLIVYVMYVINIRRYKFLEVPIFCGCANIGWEFTWGFLHHTDMGPGLQWCYRGWFFVDVYLFYAMLKYGRDQIQSEAVGRWFKPLAVFSAVSWALFVHFMVTSGLDTPIGANSAYLDQMTISAGYIMLLLSRKTLKGMSWPIAWCKMIGTGTNSIFMLIHTEYANNHMLHLLAVLQLILDNVYIVIFWYRRRAEALAAVAPAIA